MDNLNPISHQKIQIQRLFITIHGAVQGVGFRPFVYRLATDMQLHGRVFNSSEGAVIEVEGAKNTLDQFLFRLQRELPPRAFIQSLEFSYLDPLGFTKFEIQESTSTGKKTTLVLPDIATCPDCIAELFDPKNRRYRYPFTNCTNCGPRFSIIEALPYDRPNTSMKKFKMCSICISEYENPTDRRFHAQPNACPECGPQIELWDTLGTRIAKRHDALIKAIDAIRNGQIVALKGLGGFQLLVDARNDDALIRLRERKQREEKPFALMFPSLEKIIEECEMNDLEQRLLLSPESPIVILKRKLYSNSGNQTNNYSSKISSLVAPNNPYFGVMLPYTPLHHILMREFGFAIVATSGNLSDEPICIDENEALQRLHGIADLFLIHDRPIIRHCDDSIARILLNRELVLRRARGYAPLPISISREQTTSLITVGAHLKNSISLASDNKIFISQHIGDLETKESMDAFQKVIRDFQILFETTSKHVVCDLHPDYLSSKHARSLKMEVTEIQHHYAHIASCMAENQLEGEVLGISWDGTGFGLDGTIWGGEFLVTTPSSYSRVASIRPFHLPGGEQAIKEPRRSAIGILYELLGDKIFEYHDLEPIKSFPQQDLNILQQMLKVRMNSPTTSSVGRLFDAIASLLGIRQIARFEGQPAMELEFLTSAMSAEQAEQVGYYKFEILETKVSSNSKPQSLLIADWSNMITEILSDVRRKVSPTIISIKFHNSLIEIIRVIARRLQIPRIVLSGGCFQNIYLTEHAVTLLREDGFQPYWHQRIPPNDGGIALGQAYAFIRSNRKEKP
jgi:hydrogenase maturation protein HypF